MSSKPVDYDDLYYTAAHTYAFEGEQFSGIAESRFDNGSLSGRFRFKNGKQDGIAEEYYLSGAKRVLTPYVDGSPHGRETVWHENGVINIERDVEFGILMREKEFDASGNQIREYVRPQDDSMMEIVEARRRGH